MNFLEKLPFGKKKSTEAVTPDLEMGSVWRSQDGEELRMIGEFSKDGGPIHVEGTSLGTGEKRIYPRGDFFQTFSLVPEPEGPPAFKKIAPLRASDLPTYPLGGTKVNEVPIEVLSEEESDSLLLTGDMEAKDATAENFPVVEAPSTGVALPAEAEDEPVEAREESLNEVLAPEGDQILRPEPLSEEDYGGGKPLVDRRREKGDELRERRRLANEARAEANRVRKREQEEALAAVGVVSGEVVQEKQAEETAPAVEEEEAKTEEAKETSLEALKDVVAESRQKYVEKDWEHKSAWKKLRVQFLSLKSEETPDVQALRERYEANLALYKEEQLRALREKNLSGEALEKEMSVLLRYFQYEEKINLNEAVTRVRLENQGMAGSILAQYENLGKWYKDLPTASKIALSATFFVGAAVVGVGDEGWGAGVAGAAVAVRRFIAGAGLAVTLDTNIEAWVAKREEARAESEGEMQLAEFEGSDEEKIQKLETYLATVSVTSDEAIKERRKKMLWRKVRKTGAVAFGAAGATALSFLFAGEVSAEETSGIEGSDTSSDTPSDEVLKGTDEAPATTEAENPLVNSQETGEAEGDGGMESGGGASVAEKLEAPQSTLSTEEKVGKLSEGYAVTEADGAKGLWGILDTRLAEVAIPETERPQIIVSLENAIQNKIATLSPEALQAAGFPSGDINTIYVGDTLNFDQLLSKEEYQAILEGKVVEPVEAPGMGAVSEETAERLAGVLEEASPEAASSPDGIVVTDLSPERVEEIFEGASKIYEENQLSEDRLPENLIPEAFFLEEGEPIADTTREALQSGEMSMETYKPALMETRKALLLTPATDNWPRYLHAGIQEEKLSSIAKASQALALDREASLETRLHPSQVDQVARYTTLAEQEFGREARAGRSETLASYTRRIATLDLLKHGKPQLLDKLQIKSI